MRHILERCTAALRLAPLIVLLTTACGDSSVGNPLAPDIAPRLEIRDAARGGSPGFYFLTPIAAGLPSYPGVFDPDRSPVVEICQWVNGECAGEPVARFTTTEGTDGRKIQVEAAAQAYRVDWSLAGITTGKTYRIHVRDGIWDMGHADARRPAAGESPTTLKAQGIVALGNASSFPIRFRIERNTAPVVAITEPVDNVIVPAGTPLTLAGTASDAEEGDLSSQIVWRSSQQPTPLGSGASLTVALPSGRHTVSASVTDAHGATTTRSITVVASIISAPAQLNVPFGGTASLPITLSEPAPEGGLTLAITSSAPGSAAVSQGTVTIPAGALSANATISGVMPGTATVTMANPDYGMATTQVTVTAQLNITATSVSFAQGRVATITIELESGGADIAAPAGGLEVHFTPVDAGCAIVAPVTIPAGLVSTTAEVVYGGVTATPCSTVITAAVPDVAGVSTDNVTANVGRAPSLSMSATRVGASLEVGVTLSLGAPAPVGGLEVELTSADPGVLLVSESETAMGGATRTITVPAGQTSHTVYLQGMSGQSGNVVLTATAPGYTPGTTTHVVAPAVVELAGLASTTTTFSADDPFHVRVGVVNAAGTAISAYQDVRPGNGPIVVTLSNGDASVAELVRTAERGQTATVQIPEGTSTSPTTVAAGGVAFDPLGGGSTTVTASVAGLPVTSGASQTVTVSAPKLTVGSTRVGAGLQTSISVSFGAATPSELPLTIVSSDPDVLLVSESGSAVGGATRTVTVPAGQTSHTVYLQGVRGRTGSVTLTATMPGYTAASGTQTVGAAALEVAGLPSSMTTLAANDEFHVRVGVVNTTGTAISAYQNIQPGAGPITVTLANGDASVARLVRTSESGQTVTVQIPEGTSTSPTTVAAGGVAFDPLGGGSTTVVASAPDVAVIAASSQTVTVNAPNITIGSTRVGAGLQTSVAVNLGAAAPAGGVELAITNSNPGVLRLAASATGADADALSLTIPVGSSSATIYLRGVTAQTGTATITASTPGFNTGSGTQTVAPPALELAGLSSSTTTLTANDEFHVRVGVLNTTGTAISAYQNVHHGAGAITVTLTNSDATVGQLVRSTASGQTVTVQIPEGTSTSPTTVATGGVAFDPLGGGSTTVVASAPDMAVIATSSQTVTVSAPKLTVGSTRIGAGLETSVAITLGAPAPAGGLVVSFTSSNAGVLLLAATADGPGSGATTITVPAGTSSTTLYLRGVYGQAGTAIVTASAAGFTNGTGAQTVAASALELVSLPATTTALAANSAFHVRVGVLNAAGTAISAYQNVQRGGGPLTLTLANGDASVAQLVRTSESGQTVTVQIAEGASTSPTSVAAGGVAFDPVAVGSTTVTASAAGRPEIVAASRTVTVNP